jgi:myo-inositol-1(or 4)-monophosphatase
VRRKLVGEVGQPRRRGAPYDRRISGSASIECVMVAVGALDAARFRRLWIWDVAGGVALARAAGVPIWIPRSGSWVPFERFEPPRRTSLGRPPSLRDWHRPLLLGALDVLVPPP